jgi:hypothetical protein
MTRILTQRCGAVERINAGTRPDWSHPIFGCAILEIVTSSGVPLVGRLHVDLHRVGSAACPAAR